MVEGFFLGVHGGDAGMGSLGFGRLEDELV